MPNRLIQEQSPYLLQHAHNPVDWYPWGEEAFAKAQQESKPVLISIGYAACHWCHVMERESFEDAASAAYMNAHFVCVKVDREEHPDVDAYFMDAVQALTGSGGWPLNVFATPGRIPFYGGTYFPPRPAYQRPSWMQVLQRIHEIWDTQQEEVTAQSEQMIAYLKKRSQVALAKGSVVTKEDCLAMAEGLLQAADKTWGGFGGAPKFLNTMALQFLIEHYEYFGAKAALQHALLSLDKMISGGIYDQIGGGIARYSTDKKWLAPHFEKMLYDNALLISVLCDAFRVTREPRYREAITATIGFVNRELRSPEGGFYCALDADSKGEEGRFYTLKWEEWLQATSGGNPLGEAYFGILEEGNWEATNILHEAMSLADAAQQNGIVWEDAQAELSRLKQQLFRSRENRVRPMTDDKCLLSWNALMNAALCKAATVLEREAWMQQAAEHMQWMEQAFKGEDGNWKRVWKSGNSRIQAQLEDYVFLAEAMQSLGLASGKHRWVIESAALSEKIEEEFAHESAVFLYSSVSFQQEIPLRKVEVTDTVTPSGNAVMAGLLQVLGLLFGRSSWTIKSEDMERTMLSATRQHPLSFSMWALLLQRRLAGPKAVVVSGRNAAEIKADLSRKCPPHVVVVEGQKAAEKIPLTADKDSDADSLIFVCAAEACKPAVFTPEDALRLL